MVVNSRLLLLTSVAAAAMTTMVGAAMAGPSGGQVVGGTASISQSGSKTDIHQNSNKAIINWQSFDIDPAEHVEFHQPSSSAMALNRIKDTKASQIDGKLTANGHIMLINPNGIVFGGGAQVDVGSLTASTADIDNDDFMAGKLDFKHAGKSDAAIINHGNITIKEAGLANFVAPRVENHGIIAAKLGKVQLAAGDTFALDMAGDGLLRVEVTDEDAKKLVKNTGRITAEDGIVALTAARARNIVDSIVETDGIIEAHSMTQQGGKIFLGGATTKVSGTLNANGKTGGGEILIGGDYQGKGERIENAKMVDITETAYISANATQQGDGGKVIVWADDSTRFAGSIEAHGGSDGGDGGFVETSGKINLNIAHGSSVDASALHEDGANGSWLLDPSNVTITDGGANSIPGTGGTVNPGSDSYIIDAASISAALNNGNDVTITTTSGGVVEDGRMSVSNATILKNVNNNDVTLTLNAHQGIYIENSSITSTENALNLVLNGDMDGSGQGDIVIVSSSIDTNGGYFVAGGGSGALGGANGILGDGDGTGADDGYAYSHNAISGTTYGVGLAVSTITTSGGDVFINGYGDEASNSFGVILQDGSEIDSGDGNIQINAVSTGDGSTHAFALADFGPGAATLTADGGDITIDATANAGYGITLYETTSITTTDGDINLTGSSTVLADIYATGPSPTHTISSTNGDITLRVNDGDILAIDSIYAGDTLNVYTNTPTLSIGVGDNGTGGITLLQSVWDIFDAGNKIVIGEAGVQTSDMDIDTLDLSGTTYDIEFYANDITIANLIMGDGDIMAYAQDASDTGILTVDGAISRNAAGTSNLDLRADQDIMIDTATISSTTGAMNIILNSDREADSDGRIRVDNSTISTNGGFFVAGGGDGDLGGANGILGDGDGTGADDVYAYATTSSGVGIVDSSVTTSGGDIFLKGYGNGGSTDGVGIYESDLTSDGGRISITGYTTATSSTPSAVFIWGNSSDIATISSGAGDIDITGVATNGTGIYLWEDTSILATDGDISITASAPSDDDIILAGFSLLHTIESTNGNVTLKIDDGQLDEFNEISAGDTLSIYTYTPTTSIGIGGGTGDLELTTDILNLLSAGNKIVIGEDGVQTGDMDIDLWDLSDTDFDVELYANDIALGGITMGTGDILAHAQDNGGDNGNLTVDGDITRNADGIATLDLRADNTIIISGYNITATDSNSDGDGDVTTDADHLNIILNADRDASEEGRIVVEDASISTNGGYFIAGGGSGDVGGVDGILGNGDGTGADDNFAYAFSPSLDDGIRIKNAQITTLGGDVIMHGYAKDAGADDGIEFRDSSIYSDGGRISLTGISTGDSGTADGILIYGDSETVDITSSTGNIDISGTSTNRVGIYISGSGGDTNISTTDGDITITATSSSSLDLSTNVGVTISSTNEDVTINVNDIDISNIDSISAGDTLSIFTIDPTTTIGLGDGATGILNLNDTELGILSAGNKIVIGEDGVQTGDMDIDLWDLSETDFDVELYANDINLGGVTMGTGDFLAHAQDNGGDTGDLAVDGNIDRDETGTSLLDLRADHYIYVDTVSIESATGSMNIVLNADRDADEDGTIVVWDSTITTLGGYFVAGGGAGDVGGVDGILGNGDGTGADDVAAFSDGDGHAIEIGESQISTSGGDIILSGNAKGAGASRGVSILVSEINSGDGDIIITAESTGDTNNPKALDLIGDGAGTAAILTSAAGDITITANSPVANAGIIFWEDAEISSVDGNITITSSAAADNDFWAGGSGAETQEITSTNGNVTFNMDDAYFNNLDTIYAGDTLSIFTIDPTTTIGLGGGAGSLNIDATALSKMSAGNTLIIGEDGVQTGDMDTDLWNLSNTDFDVELYANDIYFGGVTMGSGDFLVHAQDNGGDTGVLTVEENIDRDESGTSTLDLRADQNMFVYSIGINSTTGAINIILNADRDADEDGRIDINTANINTNGGYFVAGGGSGDIGGIDGILGNGDGTGADDSFAYSVGSDRGVSIIGTQLTTSGGDVLLNGYAKGAGTSQGLTLSNSGVNSGDGDITLKGTSTGDTSSPRGVALWGASGTTLESAGGDINIIASASDGIGLRIVESTSSITTVDGNITITATASSDTDLSVTDATISSTNGNITLNIDDVGLSSDASISAGDTLSIFTFDPTTTIGLGDGATGILNLNDDELATLSAGNRIIIGEDGVQTGDIDLDAWDLSESSFDLELYASDISLGGIEMGEGSILAHAQDNGGDLGVISFSGNITRAANGTATLDLRADNNIFIDGYSITTTDADSDSDGDPTTDIDSLNVIFNADRDGDENGYLNILNSTITTNGGYFVAGGGSGDVGGVDGILGNGDGTGADDIAAFAVSSGDGIKFYSSSITTSGGDAILHGNAKGTGTDDGIDISNSEIISGDGRIFLTGTSTGDSANSAMGMVISGQGSSTYTLSSAGGDIDIITSSTDHYGLYLYANTKIETVDGNISITATSSSTTDFVISNNPTHTMESTNGNITLNADEMILSGATSISAGDTLSIFTIDPTTTIGLGGGTGILDLSNFELALLSAGNKIVIGEDGVQTGDMDVDAWDLSGTDYDVEVYANDITFGGIDMGAGNILVHAQDNGGDDGWITIDGNISRNVDGEATLDLRADKGIVSTGGYSITAIDSNSDLDGDATTDADSLTVIINANRDEIIGNDEGEIDLETMSITTLGGDIIMGGGTDPANTPVYGDVGIDLTAVSLNTGAGNIYLSGTGNSGSNTYDIGIAINGNSSLTTTSGDIYITGTAQSTGTNSQGVSFGATNITTESGTVRITGEAQGNNTDNYGIYTGSGFDISSTGTGADIGDIILIGTTAGDMSEAIKIEGTNDITVYDANIILTGNNGNIILDNPITKLGGTEEINVTLQADGDISLTSEGDITSSGGVMNVVLNADRDGDEDGKISLNNVDITTDGGYFIVGGGSGDIGGIDGILGNGDGTGADDIAAFAIGENSGIRLTDSNIITSGGDAIFHGYAKGAGTEHGVYILDSSISSDEGWISLTGTSTGDTNSPKGIQIGGNTPDTTYIATTSGHIDLTATATNNNALYLWKLTSITTDDGNITITASSSSNADLAAGGSSADNTISSTNGNIILNVDDIGLNEGTSIYAGDTLSIFTLDPTTTIGLGDGATGILNLNDDELAVLSAGNKIIIGEDGVQTGDMDIDLWDLSGTAFDLELYANDITFGGIDMGAGNILVHAQDNGVDLGVLDIDGNITRGVDGTALLDLRADNDIISNAGVSITATDANSDTDGDEETDADSLTVILNANRDGIVGNDEGKIDLVGMTITTLGGNVIMGGGTDPQNTAAYGSQAIVLDSTEITSGAGNIYMTGIGNTGTSGNNYGVAFTNNSDLTTTSGDMIISGTAQSTGTNSAGVYARTVDFSTETGQIEITGVALGDNTDNNGIHGSSGFDISSTGTGAGVGDIILTGTTAGDAAAIFIEGYRDITVYDADVTLTGNNGDIILDNPITKLGGTEEINVTLQADKGIYLTSEGDITSSGGVMNVVLNADRDGDEDGRISLESADITTDGGYFVAGGGSGTLGGVDGILGNGDGTGADDSYAYAVGGGSGLYLSDSEITTSGGDAVLHGNAKGTGTSHGIVSLHSTINSGDGWLSLTGTSTGDGDSKGVAIIGNTSSTVASLQSIGGNIDITGSSAVTEGIRLLEDTNISTVDGNINITAISAANKGISAGGTTPEHTISSTTGNITINSDVVGLDALTSISAGDTLSIQTLDDATTIGLGDATAGVLNLNDTELGILSAGNRIVIGDTDNTGDVHLNNVDFTGSDFILYGGAMTVDGGLDADAISFFSQDEITLNAAVSATEAGNSIIMTGTGFTNTTGLDSLDAGAGRYLIYMDAPSDVTKGGITGGNYYNATYAGNPPATIGAGLGDRFVYAYQPTLTFTADDIDISPTYDPTYSAFTYSISGLEPDDTALGSYSGTPTFTSTETVPGSGIFDISIASGSLSSLIGYNFAFADGTLTMPGTAPPPIIPPVEIPATPTTPVTPPPPSAGQTGFTNSTNSGAWNPGIERQIQVKDVWLDYDSNEYSNINHQTKTSPSSHTSDNIWRAPSFFGNREPRADVRLIEADYMEVEQPVIIFYDLCNYSVNYCGAE